MKHTTKVLMVSALTALTSVANAQPGRAGGAAAVNVMPPPAATPAVPATPNMPPTPTVPAQPAIPPSPTVSGGASAHAAGAVNRPDTRSNTNASGRVDATVSPGRSDVRADGRTASDNRLNGIDNAVAVTAETSASLRAKETLRQIQSTGFATRDQVTASVQERIEATNTVVTELRGRADAAGDKSRAAFAKALAEVRQREQEVRADLRDAAKATGENWGKIQSELAQSYGAYAKAVAEAEVAARATK